MYDTSHSFATDKSLHSQYLSKNKCNFLSCELVQYSYVNYLKWLFSFVQKLTSKTDVKTCEIHKRIVWGCESEIRKEKERGQLQGGMIGLK